MDPLHTRENYKSEWVENQLLTRVNEFSSGVPSTVFCGTWNVNNKILEEDSSKLFEWVTPKGMPLSDIYAIGFQEIVDLNASNVILDGSKTIERSDYWCKQIVECLEQTGDTFTLVMEEHLVGIVLLVFVREMIAPHISNMRKSVTPTGVMGMMGNKGAVSIRFDIYDTSLCFICSHLAAHRNNVDGRNSDTRQILEKTIFPTSNPYTEEELSKNIEAPIATKSRNSASRNSARIGLWKTYRSVNDVSRIDLDIHSRQHEFTFWMGDLNYRIHEEIPTDTVFQKVYDNELEFLKTFDQLNIERLNKYVFSEFHEGDLTFPPTYKFIPGTSLYAVDKKNPKKTRAPAWCDRILWRCTSTCALDDMSTEGVVGTTSPTTNVHPESSTSNSIKLLQYSCAENLVISDHKPVYARFICAFKVVDEEKERLLYKELLHTINKWENDSLPKVEAVGREIDFGSVGYQQVNEHFIELKNIGTTLAHWEFVSPFPPLPPDDMDGNERGPDTNVVVVRPICNPVYHIYPLRGVLAPGETVKISVMLCVDVEELVPAGALVADGPDSVSGPAKEYRMDDMTVIRVTNGSDLFCVFSASYDPLLATKQMQLNRSMVFDHFKKEGSADSDGKELPVQYLKTLKSGGYDDDDEECDSEMDGTDDHHDGNDVFVDVEGCMDEGSKEESQEMEVVQVATTDTAITTIATEDNEDNEDNSGDSGDKDNQNDSITKAD